MVLDPSPPPLTLYLVDQQTVIFSICVHSVGHKHIVIIGMRLGKMVLDPSPPPLTLYLVDQQTQMYCHYWNETGLMVAICTKEPLSTRLSCGKVLVQI